MGGRDDGYRPGRETFSSDEDYAEALRKWGLEGPEVGPGYVGMSGDGLNAAVYRGVLGHDVEQNSVIDFVDDPSFDFSKLSFGITRSAWMGMYMGIVLANCRGFVLNSMVNISWSTVGIVDNEDVEKANADFRVSLRKWMEAREVPLGWVWCLENGRTFGLHSHILAHVPDKHRHEFRDHVPAAVATIARRPVVDDRKKKIKTVKVLHAREDRFISQWRMFKYMSKSIDDGASVVGHDGIERPLREVLGLTRRQRSAVWTKRAGVNQMLQGPEQKKFFKKHGRPHIGLDGAIGPHDVFGDQYLLWGREMRWRRAELKEVERAVRLSLSLDPDGVGAVPEWALEMWEAESRRNPKSEAASYLSLFRSPRRP